MAPKWGKGDKGKRGGKGAGPLSSLQVFSAKGRASLQLTAGETYQKWPPASLSAFLYPESATDDQSTDLWYLKNGFLLPQFSSFRPCGGCSRSICTDVCHRAGWLRKDGHYCAKNWNYKINHSLPSKSLSGSCKPSIQYRIPTYLHQTYPTSAIFPRWGNRFLAFPIPLSFPNYPVLFYFKEG